AFEPGQTTAGRRVWFTGLATQLKPNDPLLLVFDGASGQPFRVRSATPDNPAQTTRVVLQEFSARPLDVADPVNEFTKGAKKALALYDDSFNPLLDKWVEFTHRVTEALQTPATRVVEIKKIRGEVDALTRGDKYQLQELLALIDALIDALENSPDPG